MSFCSQLRQLHDLYEVVNLHHSQNRVQGTVGVQVAVPRSLQHVRSSYLRKNEGSASMENMLPEQQGRAEPAGGPLHGPRASARLLVYVPPILVK